VPDAARRDRLHNTSLRAVIAGLLGSDYRPGQTTYDIAVFYTKVYNRLLIPLTATDQPQAPADLRAALAAITRHVDAYAARARLPRAA
jgi:hypothetical protein